MIKIGICDDEPVFCKLLKEKVEQHMNHLNEAFEIVCYADSTKLLLAPPDFNILFLDIQMPEQNGLQLAKRLHEEEIEYALIFVTALSEHVYDAFEFDAVDYLCKPIEDERLYKALERALKRIGSSRGKSLLIRTKNSCKSVKLDSIYYCEVINRKIYLHTKKDVFDYYYKIEELEKHLDERFVKCHRSYLVNLDFVRDYSNGCIRLENGETLPVSRLRHQEFMNAMLQYMKSGVN